MFRAFLRYMKAFGLWLTGGLDSVRKRMLKNPHVMRAGYDEIIEEKESALKAYRSMVADQTRRSESKKEELRRLTHDVIDLEKHRRGAELMAQEIVQRRKLEISTALNNGAMTESEAAEATANIEHDEEFNYCWDHFTRTSQSLEEKQRRISELEEEVEDLEGRIIKHERTLNLLKVEARGLKDEREDAVAEVMSANQETVRADEIMEIQQSDRTRQLRDLRDARSHASAEARVATKMAGLDLEEERAQFIDFATKGLARAQFKEAVGLESPKLTNLTVEEKLLENAAEAGETEAKLPERETEDG